MKLRTERRQPRLGRALAAVLLTTAATVPRAQTTAPKPVDEAGLTEIIVSAQKREQNLQDVGISATAFTPEMIEAMSLTDIGDALDFAPNVQRSFGPSAVQDGFFFFRGVGQQDVLVVVDPGVAVYLDDVYLGRLQGASFDMLDIARIEMLRGPQGTLFGRNTIGGAVSVHTQDPAGEPGLDVRVTAGERNRFDTYLAADLPLSDSVLSSASFYTKTQNGWVTNSDGATLGDLDNIGGRGKLLWNARDDLAFRLIGDYTKSEGTPTPQLLTATDDGVIDGPLGVPLPADFEADIVTDPFGGQADVSAPPEFDSERGGVSLTADWDTGGMFSLKSITAWRTMAQTAWTDLDGGPYSVYDTLFDYDQDQVSQEFQLNGTAFDERLRTLLGAYYFGEEVTGLTNICIGTTGPAALIPLPPPFDPGIYNPVGTPARGDGRCYALVSQIMLDVDAWAGFGNLEWQFTDRLTGILGLRYTSETKRQTYNTATDDRDEVFSRLFTVPQIVQNPPFALPGTFQYDVSPYNPNITIPYQYKKRWTDWTPKVGLNFAVADDTLLYASWSEGFKSGGFGGRNTPGEPFQVYDPETIDTWEVGAKTELLDNRLRINGAAFFSQYQDIQLLILGDIQGSANLFITANGGDAEIYGFEVESQALATDNLSLNVGLGYLHSKWTSLRPEAISIPEDGELPQTPKWTLSAGAQWTIAMGSPGDLVVGANYNYRDDYFFDPENLAEQDAYGVVDLRLTWRPPADSAFGDLSVAVYGLNVLEEKYLYTADDNLADLGTETVVPAPGSEWGVEVSYAFR